MAMIELTMPMKTIMYGPPSGCWVCASLDPIQIHPNGITVHIEKAPRTITATTTPAAAVAGAWRLIRCSMRPGYAARRGCGGATRATPIAPSGPGRRVIVRVRRGDRVERIHASRGRGQRGDRLWPRRLRDGARRCAAPGQKRRLGLAGRG